MTSRSEVVLATPTAQDILQARKAAGLSQQAAADLVGLATRQYWWKLEDGRQSMSEQTWALFLLATGQHPSYVLAPRPALPAVSTGMHETLESAAPTGASAG